MHKASEVRFRVGSAEGRFSRIFRANHWLGNESKCGPGSSLAETEVIRGELPRILQELGARRLLDIPCGDFYWMSTVDLPVDLYVGADILSWLVERNVTEYGDDQHEFVRVNILRDPLPKVDVVLCRDCLDHFSLADAYRALRNLATSGADHVLLTTYPARETNPDIVTGDWRPLNLETTPFSLPRPLEIINEKSGKTGYPDKSLALWAIDDIRDVLNREALPRPHSKKEPDGRA